MLDFHKYSKMWALVDTPPGHSSLVNGMAVLWAELEQGFLSKAQHKCLLAQSLRAVLKSEIEVRQ